MPLKLTLMLVQLARTSDSRGRRIARDERRRRATREGKADRLLQRSNRAVERCWTQVHVPLRHAQFPVSSEFLNRSRRRSACGFRQDPGAGTISSLSSDERHSVATRRNRSRLPGRPAST